MMTPRHGLRPLRGSTEFNAYVDGAGSLEILQYAEELVPELGIAVDDGDAEGNTDVLDIV